MDTLKRHDEIALEWIREHKAEKIPEQACVHIRHDLWCASWYSPSCNCFPDILINEQPVSYPANLLQIT